MNDSSYFIVAGLVLFAIVLIVYIFRYGGKKPSLLKEDHPKLYRMLDHIGELEDGQQGHWSYYYDNGQLKESGSFKNSFEAADLSV